MSELLGLQENVDWNDLWKLLARLALDLSFTAVVVRLVYFRLYKSREYLFTYYVFNIITFALCLLLRKVPAELGFALALFGVFGMLRYRTEQIRIRELTYLFIVIGIGILNGVATRKVSVFELVAVNLAIVLTTALLELSPFAIRESSTLMDYDRLELLKPGCEVELRQDIRERTGLDVLRVSIERVDLLRDAAQVRIFHRSTP